MYSDLGFSKNSSRNFRSGVFLYFIENKFMNEIITNIEGILYEVENEFYNDEQNYFLFSHSSGKDSNSHDSF